MDYYLLPPPPIRSFIRRPCARDLSPPCMYLLPSISLCLNDSFSLNLHPPLCKGWILFKTECDVDVDDLSPPCMYLLPSISLCLNDSFSLNLHPPLCKGWILFKTECDVDVDGRYAGFYLKGDLSSALLLKITWLPSVMGRPLDSMTEKGAAMVGLVMTHSHGRTAMLKLRDGAAIGFEKGREDGGNGQDGSADGGGPLARDHSLDAKGALMLCSSSIPPFLLASPPIGSLGFCGATTESVYARRSAQLVAKSKEDDGDKEAVTGVDGEDTGEMDYGRTKSTLAAPTPCRASPVMVLASSHVEKTTCCFDVEDVVNDDRCRRRWSELVIVVILPGPNHRIGRSPKSR
ncbi:hypothetical protein ACLOJK_003174 [Asimina triloba]